MQDTGGEKSSYKHATRLKEQSSNVFSPFLPAKFTFPKNIFISQTHLLAYEHPSTFSKDYRKDKYMSFNLKQRPILNLVLKQHSKKALLGLKKTSQSSPNCAGITVLIPVTLALLRSHKHLQKSQEKQRLNWWQRYKCLLYPMAKYKYQDWASYCHDQSFSIFKDIKRICS